VTKDNIEIETEGPNAFKNAKEQLAARDTDPQSIQKVNVQMVVGEKSEVADQMDVISTFSQLRGESVELNGGRSTSAMRAYPVLRYIADNATEDSPVTSNEVKEATGLGKSTSSTLSDLYGGDAVNRKEFDSGADKRLRFGYTGLTARG